MAGMRYDNDSAGERVPGVRHSPYGVPFGVARSDLDMDGDVDSDDETIANDARSGTYDVRADIDLDGDVDSSDTSTVSGDSGSGMGYGVLSHGEDHSVADGHRRGYTGHSHTFVDDSTVSMRNRIYRADLGVFTRRDPLGYVDGANLYGYVRGNPIVGRDPTGLLQTACVDTCPAGWDCNCEDMGPDPIGGDGGDDGGGNSPMIPHCTIPYPGGQLSDSECCNYFKNKSPCGGNSTVICCRGKLVACPSNVSEPCPSGADQSGCDHGNRIINYCALVHEKDHLDDADCANCPTGKICKPNFLPGKDPQKEECYAYKREIGCLLSNSCAPLAPPGFDSCLYIRCRALRLACMMARRFCNNLNICKNIDLNCNNIIQ